jgi:hypothetical protein
VRSRPADQETHALKCPIPCPAEPNPAQPRQPISTASSTSGSDAGRLRLPYCTDVGDLQIVGQMWGSQCSRPADLARCDTHTHRGKSRRPSRCFLSCCAATSSRSGTAVVAGMLRIHQTTFVTLQGPLDQNSCSDTRRRPIKTKECVPT